MSAKEEFKRPGFNEMIDICKKGKIDFILIDEPKRLSRNNLDISRIVDLMDKKSIKGIYATTRTYSSDNPRDKFLLQLDLSLSKMDNEDRAKDTRDKMLTCVRNGKCMTKVPFGYKNITIRKGHKDVIVDEQKREIVKIVFDMRKGGHTLLDITKFIKKNYPCIWAIKVQLLKKMLTNKFYYGIMKFSWVDYPGNHEPIVTKKLFEEANNCGRGWFVVVNKWQDYFLKWLLRDSSRMRMVSYIQKGNTYYSTQSRSEHTVNISEKLVFEKAGECLKQYENWTSLQELNKKIILDIIKEREWSNSSRIEEIDNQIQLLNSRKSELLDMRLDGKVSDETYASKLNGITGDFFELENSKKKQMNLEGISELYGRMIELSKSLYHSYKSGNDQRRALILENTMIELVVDNKKELHPQENELFTAIKNSFILFGNATENWTPAYGMKTRCPNH